MPEPRVLQIVTGLGVGGAERAVLGLTRQLVDAGARVQVVYLSGPPAALRLWGEEHIEAYSLEVDKFNPLSIASAIFRLKKMRAEFEWEIVHAHMFHSLVTALGLKVLSPGFRLVFTSHTSRFNWFRSVLIRLTRVFRDCDIVFSLGQHRSLVKPEPACIPNGTSVPLRVETRQGVPGERWRMISVGRLATAKAPLKLVEQFAKVDREDVELWIVGEGELKRSLEKRIAELGVSHKVHLMGNQADVVELLDESHLFVLASSWEGMPMVVLEAGARALPILATPVGSLPEILSSGRGYVRPIEEFPQAIEQIINHYSDAIERGLLLQEEVAANYSEETVAKRHLQLYRSLLE